MRSFRKHLKFSDPEASRERQRGHAHQGGVAAGLGAAGVALDEFLRHFRELAASPDGSAFDAAFHDQEVAVVQCSLECGQATVEAFIGRGGCVTCGAC